MTFSLETALNLRVKSVFANATATLGAMTVSGVYRAPGADALGITRRFSTTYPGHFLP